MADKYGMRAVCGLDCKVCDLRLAKDNPEQAKHISDWINENYGGDCTPDMVKCTWCKGDRDGHWSADCWILACCVDDKGLDFCFECESFPCDELVGWAAGSEKYGNAFEWLKSQKK